MKEGLTSKFRYLLLSISIVLTFWISTLAQQPDKTAQPSQDKTIHVGGDQARKFEEALKPHIDEARRTYPDARKRFLDGLPPKDHFYITVKLRDERGRIEQAFIEVKEIKDETIKGIITDEVTFVTKYKKGDEYTFPESDLIDWRITRANGTEEGNFVGKFLDTYQP